MAESSVATLPFGKKFVSEDGLVTLQVGTKNSVMEFRIINFSLDQDNKNNLAGFAWVFREWKRQSSKNSNCSKEFKVVSPADFWLKFFSKFECQTKIFWHFWGASPRSNACTASKSRFVNFILQVLKLLKKITRDSTSTQFRLEFLTSSKISQISADWQWK